MFATTTQAAESTLPLPERSQVPDKPLTTLQKEFEEPPADTKIMQIIHNWPADYNAQDSTRQHWVRNRGMGGIVSNVNFDQYMESAAHWTEFERAIAMAERDGLNLWLYDEKGYPSGNAGGLVLRENPDWEAEGILTVSQFFAEKTQAEVTIPPGKIIYVKALKRIIRDGYIDYDLADALDFSSFVEDGKLSVEIPAGYHLVIMTKDKLYAGTHAETNLHQHIPYVNLIDSGATHRFAELTYTNYAAHFGEDLGKHFEATFTDEPSLMSMFLRGMPYSPLPWSNDLEREFKNRCGYDITPYLPLLNIPSNGSGRLAKVRYDYWKTVGELISEYYFGELQEYCRKYNIPSGGHLLCEEGLATHVPTYGNFFACIRKLDAPSMDCLTSIPAEIPWQVARLLGSVAQLYNRHLVMSEASDHGQVWRAAGDERPRVTVSADQIRGSLGKQIAGGVTRFTSYYAWRERTDAEIRQINEWVGRCILMLQGGNQVSDVAVLYPAESLWTRFQPSGIWANESPETLALGSIYQNASASLWDDAREFTYIDSQAIDDTKVIAGALSHPCGAAWKVIVLPGTDTLPLATWQKLEKFVEKGGVLIAAGALPANSGEEFPSTQVQSIATKLFGENPEPFRSNVNRKGGMAIYLPNGMESLTGSIVNQVLERDFTVSNPNSHLAVLHKTFGDHETYFVLNDSSEAFSGTVRFKAVGDAMVWNPNTGNKVSVTPMAGGLYHVDIEPFNARIFTFTKGLDRKRMKNDPAFNVYKEKPLNFSEYRIGHGEFVKCQDTLSEIDGEKAWTVRSDILKSDVDTHMFQSFTGGFDLSGGQALSLDIRVPENQNIATRLLLIIKDADGEEYLAQSGMIMTDTLGKFTRVYVPCSAFWIAGWSQNKNGKLDWNKVSEIRVGWGGYYGKAGEIVEFTMKSPKLLY